MPVASVGPSPHLASRGLCVEGYLDDETTGTVGWCIIGGSAGQSRSGVSLGNPSQGDPGAGTPATIMGDRWFYEVTENLSCRVIEEAGLTLALGSGPVERRDRMDLVGDGGTSNSDIDARIASWARDNSPSGTIPSAIASRPVSRGTRRSRRGRGHPAQAERYRTTRIPFGHRARLGVAEISDLIAVAWGHMDFGAGGTVTVVGEGVASATYTTADDEVIVVLNNNVTTGTDYAVIAFGDTASLRLESKSTGSFVMAALDLGSTSFADFVVFNN